MIIKDSLPYRLVINVCVNPATGASKEIILTGETPLLSPIENESNLLAVMANALLWQASAMATAAGSQAQYEAQRRALNFPVNDRPF